MTGQFPGKLSALRRERGLNQRTVAEKLGVSQALLSHYENGAREPGLDFIVKAARFYGVSTDYLLSAADERNAGGPYPEYAQCIQHFFDATAEYGDEKFRTNARAWLSLVLYRLLRLVASPEGSMQRREAFGYLELAMKRAELRLEQSRGDMPENSKLPDECIRLMREAEEIIQKEKHL